MLNKIDIDRENGINILNESLSLYKEGEYDKAYQLYIEAGKILNECHIKSNTVEGKKSMLYGDNRNFGMIYKIFESNVKNLLSNKDGIKKLNHIMKLIKENKILKNQFDVYNTFTNPTNVIDVKKYITESISLIPHYTKDVLKEENEKLIDIFEKFQLNENVSINEDETKLFETIEFMLLNSKNFNNINEYNKIENVLFEFVNDNNKILTENISIDEIYKEKIDEMVNKHEQLLNEDEIKLINDVKDENKAKQMFENYKKSVTKLIKEEINKGVDVESWNGILDKVNKKVFESNNALIDIAELIEIKNEIEK
jgi:hypothetical protein